MTTEPPLIAVYLVTFHRHWMLTRALASILAQTHTNLIVRVVNDDPDDRAVVNIVQGFGDPRARMFAPMARRGATRNFNLMFSEPEASHVSLLEDDNWWEPGFLESMLAALSANRDHFIVVGNERIWRELPGGDWQDTGQTIWPFRDVREHRYRVKEICGSAKLVNSAMLARLTGDADLRTPDTIPVDVTEHFRERLLSPSVLLVGEPLVNYVETLVTARSAGGGQWGAWQALLIGSVFVAATQPGARRKLAERLWAECAAPTSPRAVSLVGTGFAVAEARTLVRTAPAPALARFALWAARRPAQAGQIAVARRRHADALAFLVEAPLTRRLAAEIG
jgi:hypothetical protein